MRKDLDILFLFKDQLDYQHSTHICRKDIQILETIKNKTIIVVQ